MKVIKIAPRGYCYGVVDAMVIAKNASMDKTLPRPIYILGMIVHNKHVTDAFEAEGIITVDGDSREDLLEQINEGTVIFTAHGVSPSVRKKATDKGLTVLDATCPDVTVTHDLIREKAAEGYDIVYIGKKHHPEPEGAVGVAPHAVHLIETVEDANELNIENDRILITNQTTMSQWDVIDVSNRVQERYPQTLFHKEICKATQVRQEAVAEQAKEADLTIVVGDPKSNNSNRLAQVSEEIAGTTAYRVTDLTEIQLEWLKDVHTVAVTAGASTPTPVVREVIAFFEAFTWEDESTWTREWTLETDRILPKVRPKKKA
ncbi:4-hydroxy-3-methylbut-2-enyl diphosphate reductase [Aureibacillus halotolerans]|uniref:4-hydroxy-3-methylbut-2-enyl diphosphate reductase n=1 Tax=Aureibacillus halotolerans TaxID=1508390 RepID=A0A4R6UA34_9BACI|nr:4-hydroxy-3-methylbut-2-enyl diphosphate reductase [Aureibacillus halotolerans]TDQ41719.1 4-hydroxy-3-methylbut-2-enyl diphosphate reductase [Aureibacillus halotolerans]